MKRAANNDLLSRAEEMLLLIVWDLRGEAYGASIRRRLGQLTGRQPSIGAVYVPLERLVSQGLLKAEAGEPSPVRGGRRKRYYRLTPRGVRALRQTRRITERLWANKVRWNPGRA
jgi:DNA-binding PadR family transcriptional regulator